MHRLDERDYDAAALRIAERVRSSLDIPEVLRSTLDDSGARSRRRARSSSSARRGGQLADARVGPRRDDPARRGPPTPDARQVFASGEPVVVDDVEECSHEEVCEYLERVGTRSAITFPIRWR